MDTVGRTGDDAILEGYSTRGIAVTEAVAAHNGTSLNEDILCVNITCRIRTIVYVKVLNGCAVCGNIELACDVNKVVALVIDFTDNGDRLVDSDISGVITCENGDSLAGLCSCECICDRGVILATDLCNNASSVVGVIAFGKSSARANVICNCIVTVVDVAGCFYGRALVLEYPDTSTIICIIIKIRIVEFCILYNNGVVCTIHVDNVSTLVGTAVDGKLVVFSARNVNSVCPVVCGSIGKVNGTIVERQLHFVYNVNTDTANVVGSNANCSGNHVDIVERYFYVACSYAEYAACGRSDLVVVAVDGQRLIKENDLGCFNVCEKRNGVVSLCCFESCFEGFVIGSSNLCNAVEDAVVTANVNYFVACGNVSGHNRRTAFKCICRDGYRNGPLGRAFGNEEIYVTLQGCICANSESTAVCVLVGILCPDGLVCTLDRTAVDRQDVLCLSTVEELTDCTVGGLDRTAVDNGLCISTLTVGEVIDCVRHVGAAEMLEGTVFNDQLAANLIGNNGRIRIPIAVIGRCQSDLTITGDGQCSLVREQTKVSGCVVRTRDGLAVQVEDNRLTCGNSNRCIECNIFQKLYDRAVFNSLIDCILKRREAVEGIVTVINDCNGFDDYTGNRCGIADRYGCSRAITHCIGCNIVFVESGDLAADKRYGRAYCRGCTVIVDRNCRVVLCVALVYRYKLCIGCRNGSILTPNIEGNATGIGTAVDYNVRAYRHTGQIESVGDILALYGYVDERKRAVLIVVDTALAVRCRAVNGEVLNRYVNLFICVCGNINCSIRAGVGNGLAVTVERDRLVDNKGCGESDIIVKNDRITCSCCFESICESCVVYTVDACLCFFQRSSRMICMENTNDRIGAVSFSSRTRYCNIAGIGTCNCTNCIGPVCMFRGQSNVLNRIIGCFAAAKHNTCNTACCSAGSGYSHILYSIVRQGSLAACITDDTANVCLTDNSRAATCKSSAVNNTVLYGQRAAVCVTYDHANAVNLCRIDLNVTLYCNVLNRAGAVVSKAYNSGNVVAGECAGIDRNVFKGQILDYRRVVNRTKQTGTDITVALLCGFGGIQIIYGMILTVEDTVEGDITIVADIHAPIDSCHINVSGQSHVYAGSVVLRIAPVDTVSEDDQIFQRVDLIRISLRAGALQGLDLAIAVCICLTQYKSVSQHINVGAICCCLGELTAGDRACKICGNRCTDLGFKLTAGYRKRNGMWIIGYKYGRSVSAVGFEGTAVDGKICSVIYCLCPNLTVERTAVDGHITLPETDRTVIGSRDRTAVDGGRTAILEDRLDTVCCERLSAKVLNRTAFNHEGTLVADRIRAPTKVRIAFARVGEGDLTVAGDGKVTLIRNHFVTCSASLCLADGLAIQIKNDSLACGDYDGVINRDVTEQRYGCTVCRRIDCSLESCVVDIADLSNTSGKICKIAVLVETLIILENRYSYFGIVCKRIVNAVGVIVLGNIDLRRIGYRTINIDLCILAENVFLNGYVGQEGIYVKRAIIGIVRSGRYKLIALDDNNCIAISVHAQGVRPSEIHIAVLDRPGQACGVCDQMEAVGSAGYVYIINGYVSCGLSVHNLPSINDLKILDRTVEGMTGNRRIAALDRSKKLAVLAYGTLNGDILVANIDRTVFARENGNSIAILCRCDCVSDGQIANVANLCNRCNCFKSRL